MQMQWLTACIDVANNVCFYTDSGQVKLAHVMTNASVAVTPAAAATVEEQKTGIIPITHITTSELVLEIIIVA